MSRYRQTMKEPMDGWVSVCMAYGMHILWCVSVCVCLSTCVYVGTYVLCVSDAI